MQEETPLAPAQIMLLVILKPQYLLQAALDSRGRAACCSLSGVLASGRAGVGDQRLLPHPCTRPASGSLVTHRCTWSGPSRW